MVSEINLTEKLNSKIWTFFYCTSNFNAVFVVAKWSHTCIWKVFLTLGIQWNQQFTVPSTILFPQLLLMYTCSTFKYLCNQCLSPLKLSIRIPLMTRCNRYIMWLAAYRWFSLGTPVSSTSKTDRYDITEILLKVALSTLTLFNFSLPLCCR
jgi:hypothetical protein